MADFKLDALTLPEGELNENWFPEIDLRDFLDERITQADNDPQFDGLDPAPQKRAKKAYVYEQAYRHIYRRKADDPNQWQADGQGSEKHSDQQIERWRKMAEKKESIVQTITGKDEDAGSPLQTRTVRSTTPYA